MRGMIERPQRARQQPKGVVRGEAEVHREQDEVAERGLSDEHAVEGILVVTWQGAVREAVHHRDGEPKPCSTSRSCDFSGICSLPRADLIDISPSDTADTVTEVGSLKTFRMGTGRRGSSFCHHSSTCMSSSTLTD